MKMLKSYIAFLFVLLLLFTTKGLAANNQIAMTVPGTVYTLFDPSVGNNQSAVTLWIQNNGAAAIRISFDGGATYTNKITGVQGSNPAAGGPGQKLAGGAAPIWVNFPNGPSNQRVPIVAVLDSSTPVTIDEGTNG